eukprot:gene8110-20140_t
MYFILMSLAGLGIGLTHESIDGIQLGTMVGVAVLLLYILVASGSLIIFPPARAKGAAAKPKVFVIGLSRTGTTSITTALTQLGYSSYHFCSELVQLDFNGTGSHKVNKCARLYPDSKFILTTRDEHQWGKAMVRFTQTNVKNHWLLRTHPIASKFFDAMYGDLWYTFTEETWTEKYVDFVTRVNEFFPKIHPVLRLREKEEDDEGSGDFEYENRRLLTIDLTSTSSTGHDKWEQLTAFLDIDNPFPLLQQPSTSPAVAAVASSPAAPSSATGSLSSPPPRREFPSFPRTDVFVLTFGAQAFQQFKYLAARIATPAMGVLLLAALFFWPLASVSSYDQCTRSCRAAAGSSSSSSATAATPLPGIAEAAEVADGGTRELKGWRNWWTDPSTCTCYEVSSGQVVDDS